MHLVVERLADLAASWMVAGFVHGVMNMCGQLTGWLAPIALGWMTRYPTVGEFRGEGAVGGARGAGAAGELA